MEGYCAGLERYKTEKTYTILPKVLGQPWKPLNSGFPHHFHGQRVV